MPPSYVKPYVKRGKSDAADAAAICEAVTHPTMRFVAINSEDQQAILCQHRVRQALVGQRTQLANMIRGLLSEFGITMPTGIRYLHDFALNMQAGELLDIPETAEDVIASLCDQFIVLDGRIDALEKAIFSASKKDARVELPRTIPGIGPITASAFVNVRCIESGVLSKRNANGCNPPFGTITRLRIKLRLVVRSSS